MKKCIRSSCLLFTLQSVLNKRAKTISLCSFSSFILFLLLACTYTPENIEEEIYLNSAEIGIISQNGDTSYALEIPNNENFKLFIKTSPHEFKDSLEYSWFKKDSLLSNKNVFSYTNKKSLIPDSVTLNDKFGNTLGLSFKIILNSPPEIIKILSPAKGDTLVGDKNTPFLFAWNAFDADGDTLHFFIEKDSILFPVGMWDYAHLSHFSEGNHKFRIIANDLYNSADTSAWIHFYVKEQ